MIYDSYSLLEACVVVNVHCTDEEVCIQLCNSCGAGSARCGNPWANLLHKEGMDILLLI